MPQSVVVLVRGPLTLAPRQFLLFWGAFTPSSPRIDDAQVELRPHFADTSRLKKLHAFVGYGDFDNTLPVVWAERSVALLEELDVEFESHRYPTDHCISPAMRDDFLR